MRVRSPPIPIAITQKTIALTIDSERTGTILATVQLAWVRISQLFGEICAQARRRAERDPKGAEILGPFEDLLTYQLAPAKKAVATKAKAKAAAKTTPPAATPGPHPA